MIKAIDQSTSRLRHGGQEHLTSTPTCWALLLRRVDSGRGTTPRAGVRRLGDILLGCCPRPGSTRSGTASGRWRSPDGRGRRHRRPGAKGVEVTTQPRPGFSFYGVTDRGHGPEAAGKPN